MSRQVPPPSHQAAQVVATGLPDEALGFREPPDRSENGHVPARVGPEGWRSLATPAASMMLHLCTGKRVVVSVGMASSRRHRGGGARGGWSGGRLGGQGDAREQLDVVQQRSRPAHHAGERIVAHADRQAGLVVEQGAEAAQQRAAA